MKILVIGSGGREHALCRSIQKSPKCEQLFCAPGNPGISEYAVCLDQQAEDIDGLLLFSIEEKIDLVIVGPEIPLVMGISDRFASKGIKVFGPSAAAAKLEGSKVFMKEFCEKNGIPTATFRKFTNSKNAIDYINVCRLPIVIKADGLAAGKGVIICHDKSDARDVVNKMMIDDMFGKAGSTIVVEEYLEGEEISFFALVCEGKFLPLATAQDHKRAFDGDMGPNTGGMGAYSPASIIDSGMNERIIKEIIQPTIEGLAKNKTPYRGVLFAGLMITDSGPKLIEYNCRFGDPECQTMLARLESDAVEMFLGVTDGNLADLNLSWSNKVAVTVILASKGYPGEYKSGSQILGLEKINTLEGIHVSHSGTSFKGGEVVANGGRVLGVTATGDDFYMAHKRVYQAVRKIDWPEGFFRSDIGWREISR